MPLRFEDRPPDQTPIHSAELPDLPQRDRRILASAWIEAPEELVHLGNDLSLGEAGYIRRIHGWLLWRAGPPSRGDTRYLAVAVDDVAAQHSFRLYPDGTGNGIGPSGETHTRFRTWKEDLRDHARPGA